MTRVHVWNCGCTECSESREAISLEQGAHGAMTNKHPLPWNIVRDHELSTGWRGISIRDASGVFVANIVMQLDDSEMEVAQKIVEAVNALERAS